MLPLKVYQILEEDTGRKNFLTLHGNMLVENLLIFLGLPLPKSRPYILVGSNVGSDKIKFRKFDG